MSQEVSNFGRSAKDLPRNLFGFEVVDFIGRGAGSSIYAVVHPDTHQLYALKHVVRRSEKDERFIEQLETEYEIGRKVSHEGLRRSIEFKANRTFLRKMTDAALVLELFDGQPLESQRPRTLSGLVECFIQSAHALDALHSAGYVHCDIKPNNILIGSASRVKVIDLGQTCAIGTAKKRIQGTPDYIAPEQVKLEAVTPRTDIYNLGATLYWALSGRNLPTLFTLKRGENSLLSDGLMQSPRELNSEVPQPLSNLVMECVRVNPAKRPADMSELARRLEAIHFSLYRSEKANSRSSGPMALA